MSEQERILIGLTSLLVLGVGGQWLAARLKLPAILVLLLFGLAAGAGTEWLVAKGVLQHRFLDPNGLFGPLLLPIVSLSVALILFEGGLTLNVAELTEAGRVIRNLVSVGALVTWVLSASAAHFIVGLPWPLSWLLGAILVVTGPTVIGPLLRHVKPVGPAASILKWEGIVIDPIGAILAVLVFEAINIAAHVPRTEILLTSIGQIAKAAFFGGVIGLACAALLVLLLRRYWAPDVLHNAITVMLVIGGFTASNLIQHESGLVTVTVMGIALANQKSISVRHILEFKESLSTLLIGSLFILLGSRLKLEQLQQLGWRSLIFLAIMILIVRPASVLVSTMGSGLQRRHKVFLAWMAPRGIVAASVSAIFAIRLREAGYPDSERLVPLTFCIIIGTVTIYGLTSRWLAARLGLRPTGPTGFLIAGANPLARAIGHALRKQGVEVVVVDTNRLNVQAARDEGLPVLYASVSSRYVTEKVETGGFGRLLALTSSEEVNSLAALHFSRIFGRDSVYQLRSASQGSGRKEAVHWEFRGRPMFGGDLTYTHLAARLDRGAMVTAIPPAEAPDGPANRDAPIIPLFMKGPDGDLRVVTVEEAALVKSATAVVALVDAPALAAMERTAAANEPQPPVMATPA